MISIIITINSHPQLIHVCMYTVCALCWLLLRFQDNLLHSHNFCCNPIKKCYARTTHTHTENHSPETASNSVIKLNPLTNMKKLRVPAIQLCSEHQPSSSGQRRSQILTKVWSPATTLHHNAQSGVWHEQPKPWMVNQLSSDHTQAQACMGCNQSGQATPDSTATAMAASQWCQPSCP